MQERKIRKMVKGQVAQDGAGVKLVRVLGHDTVEDFDPFLMLDSFDSTNPDDYTRGFPMHPHRGIETVTYLISGEIDHEDSLGNMGRIGPGESQWMTAGSGIMHQEMPQPAERMLGFQLWLNLPKKDKMCDPQYYDIREDTIGEVETEEAKVRVIAGEYGGAKGARTDYIQASLYDVALKAGKSMTIPTKKGENVFVFLIEGDAVIEGKTIEAKTAVLFDDGEAVTLTAPEGQDSRIIFYAGQPIREEVAWGGPIVMNTKQEIIQAFRDMHDGTFTKHEVRVHHHSGTKPN
ncbi:pirin family protein [Ruminococcaceae bacterium OttesenSCG-928-I18]|nr:pirin family protein [Ruminococcaceae bacterium OttesenSCG-928-I18]